jgi:hypothetical protein
MAKQKGYAYIEEKVLQAIPCWNQWTRQLRRIYLALPAFGSSDFAIQEICEELGFNYESVQKKIITTPSFSTYLKMYRTDNAYPIVTQREDGKYTYRIKHEDLKQVYGQYADIINYFHMEDLKAQGKGSEFSMRVIDQRKLVEMNAPDVEEKDPDAKVEVKLFDTA